MKLQLIGHNLRDTNMKKLLLLLSLISFNAFATDRGVPCNSNSCKVKIVTKDSGGSDVTSAEFSSSVNTVLSDIVSGASLSDATAGAKRFWFKKTGASTAENQIAIMNINAGTNSQIIISCYVFTGRDPNAGSNGSGIYLVWGRVSRLAGAGSATSGTSLVLSIEGTPVTPVITMTSTGTNEWRMDIQTAVYNTNVINCVSHGRTNSGILTWL